MAAPGRRVAARWVDLAGDDGLESLVAGHDMVIHAAGRVENPRHSAAVFERDNARAAEALIAAALASGCRRLINLSSLSVYGSIDTPVVDELTPSSRPSFYGASKLVAEAALRAHASKLHSISLRLPGIVGPRAHGNWLSRCRATLRSGAALDIANPEFQFNNVVHVEGLAAFIAALCGREWEGSWAFPIGAGIPMSILDLVSAMRTALGSTSQINVTSDDRRPFAISSDLAIREFRYHPMSVREIIQRFVADD